MTLINPFAFHFPTMEYSKASEISLVSWDEIKSRIEPFFLKKISNVAVNHKDLHHWVKSYY